MHARSAPQLRHSWPHLVALLVAGLAVSLPIVLWGFCLAEPIHLIWARHFADQLWSGELYPRWLMDMNSGLGSPTFFFYGAVPFYVSSLFHAVVPAGDFGWLSIGFSASLALLASGFTAFVWLRGVAGRNAALAGALAYLVLPYHLEIDHLVRFAFAECWAFVSLPLVLAGAHRCAGGDGHAVVPLALAYALLVMTHPPSTLLFSAVPVGYALWMAPRGQVLRGVTLVVGGMLLGGMLGAIYLMPALLTQQNASLDDATSGYFSYLHHFLFTTAPLQLPERSQTFLDYAVAFRSEVNRATRVTAAIVLGSFVTLLLLARGERGAQLPRGTNPYTAGPLRFATFWAVIAVASIFMMSPLSAGIWRVLPILQKVQFPWRFNILLVCAAAAIFAAACAALIEHADGLRKKNARPSSVFAWPALVVAGVVVLLGSQLFKAAKTLNEIHSVGRSVPARIFVIDQVGARPSTLRKEHFTQDVFEHLGRSLPQAGIANGTGRVDVLEWRPRHIVLAVDAESQTRLVVKQLYYPGWTARSRGESVVLPVAPAEPIALVSLVVPPGKHEIALSLDASIPERAGQALSAAAVIVVALIAWRNHRNGHAVDANPAVPAPDAKDQSGRA
jgi:hypothetical protein